MTFNVSIMDERTRHYMNAPSKFNSIGSMILQISSSGASERRSDVGLTAVAQAMRGLTSHPALEACATPISSIDTNEASRRSFQRPMLDRIVDAKVLVPRIWPGLGGPRGEAADAHDDGLAKWTQ